ncbi:MAG TPA: beta-galactosidase family protein [Trebonia sp.]|jgi:beta-galactosidase|nr:beta-galactosidase family protein [Trebonia sp.]
MTEPGDPREPRKFIVGERDFLLDGEPLRILSGALHYFRVHPGHWADRIRKARQMGLNTIETYVAWNAHAPGPEEFRLDGGLDLGRFLDLVAAEGMFAIVRPGPYICAELTNGGLPGWLRGTGVAAVRSSDQAFMTAVRGYLGRLGPVVVSRRVDRGGPIIMMQVENEYGAYGRDRAYLSELADLIREIGITVPLNTVDQPIGDMLANGGLPGVLATGSFGGHVTQRLAALRAYQADGPLMCSEFWHGWFDDWGGHHHVTPVAEAAGNLDAMLRAGASVNIYMFHGGTNFGLTNGANDKGTYHPITTSYDYDAPLDEAGNPTAKYWAFRDVIAGHATVSADVPAAATATAPAFTVPFGQALPLWDALGLLAAPAAHDSVITADEAGQYQGLTLYATELDGPVGDAATDRTGAVLTVGEVRDRAQVFLNRRAVGVLARDHHDTSLALPPGARGRLELLVEDQGRVDYGGRIGEPKGLIGPVSIDGTELRGWEIWPMPLDDIAAVAAALRDREVEPQGRPGLMAPGGMLAGPAFARAVFDVTEPADLYLSTAGWGKGIAWVNGFCLGRYWSRGPQRTLYVPGPATRPGGNELIILELQAASAPVAFRPGPDLGHTEL